MRTRFNWILLFLVVLAGGMFFRLWRLNDRPMHTDEAVHAEKFAALLEKGFYVYDPEEFHGPTLNYFTLISAYLRGEKSYAAISETTLRLIPAVFGIGLILTPLLFLKGMNRRAVFFSCVLIAFSPAFVYYSRYYIQEILLVFFAACLIGCTDRYLESRKFIWIMLSGICLGLMHATKETFVFTVVAAAVALATCKLMNIHSWKIKISHLLGSVFAAVFVSVLFYSSFGTNWQGIADSVMTYAAWGKRAGGQSVHVHPWYFYLNLLTWNEFTEPMTWNEDGIVVLAVFGVIFAFTRRTLLINRPALIRFWAIYTVILAVIYCSISYKTPWCVLGFLYGMAILAGFVIDWLVRISETCWEKICLGLLIVIFVILSPVVQSWMLNFHYASEPTNPYVYAHTSTDIYPMVEAVNKAANASGTGKQMPIQVIAAGDDYWPLSWYLRTYTKVGYWSDVNHSAYKAPVILTNAEHEQKLLDVLYSVPEPGQRYLYVPLFEKNMQLRPGVEWRGYIRKNLWDRMNTAQEPVPVSPEQKGSGWVNKPDKKQIENLLKFSHEAMNTSFEVYIQDPRGTYAGRAARAAFNEVDCLEKLLSRFIQNSDVSRINHSTPGETVIVDEDTMTCLLIAKKAYEITKGAFDVTIGNMIETEKNGGLKQARQQLTEQSSMDMLELDKDAFAVKRLNETVNIDLGGIGKGYAVDTIARVLTEWGIQTALIHGGSSSVCAMAPPQGRQGWPITITNPVGEEIVCRLELTNEVLSCSGLEKGGHIIDPSTGKPVTDRIACWVRLSESAALADALSTAGMIVPLDKIQDLTHEFPDIFLMLIMDSADTGSGELLKFGRWPDN